MNNALILLAQIGAAHGIRGEVRVKPFGEADMLNQYGKLEASDGRRFKIKRMRVQKSVLVVKFEDVNTREEAEALNGLELFVSRAKLPEPEDEEFYVSDLTGMEARDKEGSVIGTIANVPNFGAGDMLEISPSEGGGNYYLPFTKEVVPDIDFSARYLTIVPPAEVSERDDDTAI